MSSETKQCRNCETNFVIDPDDFGFYEKIGVSPPTLCPPCRMQRRKAWRNDITFYTRTCDKCDRRIVSIYSPDKPMTVYCTKCWWSDSWDPVSYGRDVDFTKPFFEQFRELQDSVPLMAMVNDDGVGSVNCEYTQNVSFAKNCYMGAMSWKNEDCYYYYHVAGPETKNIVDCYNIFQGCETAYDSIFLERCFKCRNCYYSSALVDCVFCYDCHGCSDSFMCHGLRNKRYHFKNHAYSKEEYENIIKKYRLDTWSGAKKAESEFREFISRYPHRFAQMRNCPHSTGDAIFNCKNVKNVFSARGCEDTKYFEWGNLMRDCYDLTTGGETSESYEGLTADMDSRALFTIFTWKSQDVTYCQDCHSSKDLFGCVSLKHARYCILNKQYSKKEYHALKEKLIGHMKSTGEYGEFFPAKLSNFGYNETVANIHFPLSKEEALAKKFKWENNVQSTTGKETCNLKDIPDSINDVKDSILEEVFSCEKCLRNFKIVPEELKFLKKMAIPIPRYCFFCRNKDRMDFAHPHALWKRTCSCPSTYQNTRQHFHGGKLCPNEFETTYAPDRPEIVYCEQCYQAEMI